MMQVVKFELFPGRTLHAIYYQDVVNAAELQASLIKQEIDVALINANMICDFFQVEAAAARTLLSDSASKLTTKTIHAELVFNLSGSRNVTESFRRFGIAKDSKNLLVCCFDASQEQVESMSELVKGKAVSLDELPKHADVKLLKKYYKIQDQELACSSLIDAVVCRIATKTCHK